MSDVAGLILAGGRSLRMGGGDKSLRELAGRPLLDHVARRIAPQVGALSISANGDPRRFSGFSLPVLPDTFAGFAGPLAGILAGMEWAMEHTNAPWLVSVASDTPFFPKDLVERLASARRDQSVVVASSSGRRHPVFALWPVDLQRPLRAFLEDGATYKVSAFVDRHEGAQVDFPMIELADGTVDPFFNVNTPEDLVEAERIRERIGA